MDFGEFFGPALVIGIVVFVLVLGAFIIGGLRQKKKISIYKEYVKEKFPDLPDELLMANQTSKSAAFEIGLVINEPGKKLILLFKTKGEMTHKVYPFESLSEVNSSSEVISRGLPTQKTYSYQRTMSLSFIDGNSYQFILENISNKQGVKGSDVVLDMFRPWENKLNQIVG